MSKIFRIKSNPHEDINRSETISFSWNNKQYKAYKGDTLASALLANGIKNISSSYKYGRTRGIYAPWAEEPNAIVTVDKGKYLVPNMKATQTFLYQNLEAYSPKQVKICGFDLKKLFSPFHNFMSAGFYYKTFMSPKFLWHTYERLLRKMAGMSQSPLEYDEELYENQNHFVDLLVIGGGVSGIKSALVGAENGLKVMLVDDRNKLGGFLTNSNQLIERKKAVDWIAQKTDQLNALHNVKVLTKTNAFARGDYNYISCIESCQNDIELSKRNTHKPREIYHKIRAKKVALASGAQERLIAFQNNDLPGIMIASALYSLVKNYSVSVGQNIIIFTNNNSVYSYIDELIELGVNITAIVDSREKIEEQNKQYLESKKITLYEGFVVKEANGLNMLSAVQICPVKSNVTLSILCDTLAVSGGLNPVIHLSCHTGNKGVWAEEKLAFMGEDDENFKLCGCVNLYYSIDNLLKNVTYQTELLLANLTSKNKPNLPIYTQDDYLVSPVFYIKQSKKSKAFIDLQNDVTIKDIEQSIDENYKSIEHIKRYTALGFGTDQGKIGNVVGVAIAADILEKNIGEVSTTTFRPSYSPVSFGSLVGRHTQDMTDPIRYSPIHFAHSARNCDWENVGQWKRPWYFPQENENIHQAVNRESYAIRNQVGMMDASTLGKIDIQGPDAREFLNRVYTNSWTKLGIQKCRYGLMLDEKGMIIDDGVTMCLDENHFMMTTTTGGAAKIYSWLEMWLQTEWADMKVYITSVTDHWSTIAVVGPKSRDTITQLCSDIDFANENFPFMEVRKGTICGIPTRITRISFSGELAYEVNVQANYGRYIWEEITQAAEKFGVTHYGTETMHVLRAEKGYIIVGQDTDGSQTPIDMGMSWTLANKKPFSFIGKRSLALEQLQRQDRKQLVGIYPHDKEKILPEGVQFVANKDSHKMLGYSTSSYFSPNLGRSFAMANIIGGQNIMGQTIFAKTIKGEVIPCEVTSFIFYDEKGEKRDG